MPETANFASWHHGFLCPASREKKKNIFRDY